MGARIKGDPKSIWPRLVGFIFFKQESILLCNCGENALLCMANDLQRLAAICKQERPVLKNIKYIVFDHDGTLVDTASYPTRLYPGMKDLINDISDLDCELFVWTARNRNSTIEILDSLGIISEFKDLSCVGSSEAAQKPSPEGIQNMLLHAESRDEVIVIGDSLGDMIGGKRYGAHTIGALWSHGNMDSQQTYIDHGADIFFTDINECRNYLIKKIRGK